MPNDKPVQATTAKPNRHVRRQVRDAAKVAERRRKKDEAARVAYWQAVREQAAKDKADMQWLREAWAHD